MTPPSAPRSPAGSSDDLSRTGVDFSQLFAALPTPYVVLTPDVTVVEVNEAYARSTGRQRDELVGQYLFAAFPPDPATLDADGMSAIGRSFREVCTTRTNVTLPIEHYPIVDDTGNLSDRFWLLVAAPVFDASGEVALIVQRAEDVTEFMTERDARTGREVDEQWRERAERFEADLFARAAEVAAALEAKDAALSTAAEALAAKDHALAAQEVAARQIARLAEVGLALTRAETVADLEQIVIGEGVAVLGADGGALVAVEGNAWRLTVDAALGDPAQTKYAYLEYDNPLPGCWTARTGERLLLPNRAAGLAFTPAMSAVYEDIDREAWAFLPLTVGDERLGALAVSWVGEHDFTTAELDVLDGFAAQCSQTLHRIRSADNQRAVAERALELAGALQQALLTPPPEPDHLHVVVRYRPAADIAQVGGDWYDAFMQPDGATMLVVGDVTGHDSVAAAKMGQLRGLLRALAYAADDSRAPDTPAAILSRVEHAARGLDVTTMATAVLARIERRPDVPVIGSRTLRWSNAGHVPPVLLHPDGRTEFLDPGKADLLLGVVDNAVRRDHEVELPDGVTLVLFTDGLVERREVGIDEGLADLRTALSGLQDVPLDELCDTVLARMAPHTGDDDIALVAVRTYPEDRPRPAEAGPNRTPETMPGR